MLPVLLFTGLLPVLTRAGVSDPERFAYTSERSLEVALILGTGIAVGMILGAEPIVDVIAGQASAPSIDVLRLHAIAVGLNFFAVACNTSLLALGRLRELVLASSIAFAVTVVVTLALASGFGAQGAAAAYVITDIALATTVLIILLRVSPRRPSLRNVPWVLGAGAVAMAAWLVPVAPVFQAALGLVVYAGILIATGRIPGELLDALRQPFARGA